MKIEISRSFSKKIQLKTYEPIEFFCAAKIEADLDTDIVNFEDGKTQAIISEKLDKFVQLEVEKSLAKFMLPSAGRDTKKSKDIGLDDFGSDLEIESKVDNE